MARKISEHTHGGKPNERRADQSPAVPGPTHNSATNLIITDLAVRAGSIVLRQAVEKGLLSHRYDRRTARKIVENRSLVQKLTLVAISKIATKSVPGAVLVGSGLAVKTLYDRSKHRRAAKAQGDADLLDDARD